MPAVPADLCINARWIVPMSTRGQILEDHSLVVLNGRILDLIPTAGASERYAASVVVDRPAHLLMPGFVNAHTHAGMSLFRGYAEGLPLKPWLEERIRPLQNRFVSAEFVRDGTLLSIAEMLESGITCFSDMYYFPDETARAAVEQGIRAVIGMPVAEYASPWARTADEYLSRALAVRDEYKDHPSIATAFAPHAPYTVSDATFTRIATYADELDAGVLIHLHESAGEIADSLARHRVRPIERLHGLGLLTPALNAIHMVHVEAADMELAQRSGISVTLCPESNLKLGNGWPPIAAWLATGVRLGVGSDGAASNNDQDVWSEMKLLALLSRTAADAVPALSPWDALATATRGGAAALGLDAEIGTLESGKWADLCCVDLSGPATQPIYDPVTQLVFSGGRDLVSDVWVAGRQLLDRGNFTRLDWPRIAARASHWATRLSAGE
jgi:5-methylthioadenosine/S-adenosylhomocysteine deaminase